MYHDVSHFSLHFSLLYYESKTQAECIVTFSAACWGRLLCVPPYLNISSSISSCFFSGMIYLAQNVTQKFFPAHWAAPPIRWLVLMTLAWSRITSSLLIPGPLRCLIPWLKWIYLIDFEIINAIVQSSLMTECSSPRRLNKKLEMISFHVYVSILVKVIPSSTVSIRSL